MAVWNRLKLIFITLVAVREFQLSAAQLVSRICGKWLTSFCPSCHRPTRAWNGGVNRPNHRKVKKLDLTQPNPTQPTRRVDASNSRTFLVGCTSYNVRGYNVMWSKISAKLFQPSSTSVRNNFARNYFKTISETGCSSWIFSNMFNVAEIIFEIISELFQRLK